MSGEALYEMLLDYADLIIPVEHLQVGIHWTLCQAGSLGVAATFVGHSGSAVQHPLAGRSLAELSRWLRHWDHRQAGIGLAAVNAAINREADMVYAEGALFKGPRAAQACFDWFLPLVQGQRCVVLGDKSPFSWPLSTDTCHLLPVYQGALPAEAEYLLPRADWVFIPAQTIADKTLPRILELAGDARCVLYGPETPWLDEWQDFGIDYLMGIQIDDAPLLRQQVAEAGDIAQLGQAISYRLVSLNREQSSIGVTASQGR